MNCGLTVQPGLVSTYTPEHLSFGLPFTTGTAVTKGLLADLVDKLRVTGSTAAECHDTETKIGGANEETQEEEAK